MMIDEQTELLNNNHYNACLLLQLLFESQISSKGRPLCSIFGLPDMATLQQLRLRPRLDGPRALATRVIVVATMRTKKVFREDKDREGILRTHNLRSLCHSSSCGAVVQKDPDALRS